MALRPNGHPVPGRVRRRRVDPTRTGSVIEVEEEWDQHGQRWYCRELMRADVEGGALGRLSVYRAGDRDEQQQRRHGGRWC